MGIKTLKSLGGTGVKTTAIILSLGALAAAPNLLGSLASDSSAGAPLSMLGLCGLALFTLRTERQIATGDRSPIGRISIDS